MKGMGLSTILFIGVVFGQSLGDLFSAPSDTFIPRYREHLPHVKNPEYIRVWRGSYRDAFGNYVEAGWEWIKIREALPETNF